MSQRTPGKRERKGWCIAFSFPRGAAQADNTIDFCLRKRHLNPFRDWAGLNEHRHGFIPLPWTFHTPPDHHPHICKEVYVDDSIEYLAPLSKVIIFHFLLACWTLKMKNIYYHIIIVN